MAVEKVKKTSVKKKSTKGDLTKTIERRINVLKQYDAKASENSPDVMGDDEKRSVFLQFTFTHSKSKPDVAATPIKVPNPVYDPASVSVCLFVRAPQRKWKDKFQAEKEAEDCSCVQRIIDLDHFARKYPTYKDKRSFVQSYDLFFCDNREASKAPGILGQEFKRTKKVPRGLPLRSTKTIREVVLPALSETSLFMKCGSTTSIRIGDIGFGPKHLAENAVAVIKYMEDLMKRITSEVKYERKDGEPQIDWKIMRVVVQLTNSISVPLIEKETEIADEMLAIAKKELEAHA